MTTSIAPVTTLAAWQALQGHYPKFREVHLLDSGHCRDLLARRGIRDALGRGRGGQGNESALGVLKRRYARGEIDKTEFEEKKKDVLGS